jgi:hypothetical protein
MQFLWDEPLNVLHRHVEICFGECHFDIGNKISKKIAYECPLLVWRLWGLGTRRG